MCSEYNQFIKRENSLGSIEQKVSIIYDKTGLIGTCIVLHMMYINLHFKQIHHIGHPKIFMQSENDI